MLAVFEFTMERPVLGKKFLLCIIRKFGESIPYRFKKDSLERLVQRHKVSDGYLFFVFFLYCTLKLWLFFKSALFVQIHLLASNFVNNLKFSCRVAIKKCWRPPNRFCCSIKHYIYVIIFLLELNDCFTRALQVTICKEIASLWNKGHFLLVQKLTWKITSTANIYVLNHMRTGCGWPDKLFK